MIGNAAYVLYSPKKLRGLPRSAACFASFAALFSIWAGIAMGQEISSAPGLSASIVAEETGSENLVPDNADAESEKTIDNLEALPVETITLPLPRTLPDGRGIRPIALFSSQMDVLVSKEFLPVAIEQLRSALVSQQSESGELLSTQISSSQYVVELQENQLICRRGSLRVSTKFAPQTTIPLGRQSVAVRTAEVRPNYGLEGNFTPFEFDADGRAYASFPKSGGSDESFDYLWSCRGKSVGNSTDFKLNLPLAKQTTIFLAIPSGKELNALNAVATRLESIDPAILELVNNQEVGWYQIEAGGVDQLDLTIVNDQSGQTDSLVVRLSQMQCDLRTEGMSWTKRFILKKQPDIPFPNLLFRAKEIIEVKLDGESVPFLVSDVEGGHRYLSLAFSESGSQNALDYSTLSVSGFSPTISLNTWIDLPILAIEDALNVATAEEIQISISDPFQLVGLNLPASWESMEEQRLENGNSIVRLFGPLRDHGMDKLPVGEQEADTSNTSIDVDSIEKSDPTIDDISLLLAEKPAEKIAETDIRFEVDKRSLKASAKLSIPVDQQRALPIELVIEDEWELLTLRFAESDRLIAKSLTKSTDRIIEIWPEANELTDGTVELLADGERRLRSSGNQLSVPASWFIRSGGGVGANVRISITPSAALTWDGGTALQPSIMSSMKSNDNALFHEPINVRTLWFAPINGTLPAVDLVSPSVAYTASTQLLIGYQDGQLIEELRISIESESQSLSQIFIQTEGREGYPDYQWNLQKEDGTEVVQLNGVRKRASSVGDEYDLDLTNLPLNDRYIVAKRVLPASEEMNLLLPTVIGSATQDAEILLHPALQLEKQGQLLSVIPTSRQKDIRGSGTFPNPYDANTDRWLRLRYDPVNQTTISINTALNPITPNLVRYESIRCIGSVSGTDKIQADYRIYSTTDFRLVIPSDCRLIDVHRNGVSIEAGISEAGEIRLPATYEEDNIRLNFERRVRANWLTRSCEMPEFKLVDAVVLSSQYDFVPMPDSAVINLGVKKIIFDLPKVMELTEPKQAILLGHYEHLLALGCFAAFGVFGASVLIGRHSTLALLTVLMFALAAGFTWFALSIAFYAWIIIPIVSGGLLAIATRGWFTEDSVSSARGNDSPTREDARNTDDFSVTDLSGRALVVLLCSVLSGGVIHGQELADDEIQTPDTAVNVLVPVDASGARNGDVVYVPKKLFTDLFSKESEKQASTVRFESATYRVNIQREVDTPNTQVAYGEVQAEYVIINKGSGNSQALPLPIDFEGIRRIELLGETTRILPFEREGRLLRLVTSPNANLFKIRVTFKPKLSKLGRWERLELPIPSIANSRITVESGIPLDAVRLGGSNGWLVAEETGLSRSWVDDLGPTNALTLDVRGFLDGASTQRNELSRRYWVRAGAHDVVIDCELDLPDTPAIGESFQFVVLDSRMPTIIGSSWRLVSSELYSPSRRLVTVESASNQAEPIQLVWKFEVDWQVIEEEWVGQITIPEVIASALGNNSDPWVALQCETNMKLPPILNSSSEPMAVDQFLSRWRGFRGSISRAFVPVGSIPVIEVRRKITNVENLVRQHSYHAHVDDEKVQVHYRSELIINGNTPQLPQLFVTDKLRVNRINIDGQPVVLPSKELSNGTGYYVIPGVGKKTVNIDLFAEQPLADGEPFQLPAAHIVANSSAPAAECLLTCMPSTKILEKDGSPYQGGEVRPDETLLGYGVPLGSRVVASWIQRLATEESEEGLFANQWICERENGDLTVDQSISLSRTNRRWTMKAVFRFRNDRPRSIWVEVPTIWTEDISVLGGEILQKVPAIEESRTVLEIGLLEEHQGRQGFSLQGRLDNLGTTRIGVPRISMLNIRTGEIYAAVPKQLDGQKAKWRTSAVDRAKIPDDLDGGISSGGYQAYRAVNSAYSIDLAPLPDVESKPNVFCSDTHVFPQKESLLVLTHWDIYPGNEQAFDVDLPESCEVLAIWSDGRSTKKEVTEINAKKVLKIPFALDRYSHSIQLLVRMKTNPEFLSLELPRLRNLDPEVKWLSVYRSDNQSDYKKKEIVINNDQLRRSSLARAVVNSIEVIVNSGQYGESEVKPWLSSRVQRYLRLTNPDIPTLTPSWKQQNLKRIFEQDQDTSNDTSSTDWDNLDKKIREMVQNFSLNEEDLDSVQSGALFPVREFDGYRTSKIWGYNKLECNELLRSYLKREHSVSIAIQPIVGLSLLGFMLLWVQRNPISTRGIVENPSFWLFILGLSCSIVLPIPIAAGLILIAVIIPLLSNSKFMQRLAIRWQR